MTYLNFLRLLFNSGIQEQSRNNKEFGLVILWPGQLTEDSMFASVPLFGIHAWKINCTYPQTANDIWATLICSESYYAHL